MEDAIVLYPSPGMGHLISMVELGKLILKHHPSFSITILILTPPYTTGSTAQYIATVNAAAPSLTFHHLPTIPLSAATKHVEQLAFELSRLSNPNLHQALQTISHTSNLKALIFDFFNNAAFEVATNLHIPAFYYYTSGASSLTGLLYTPTLHRNTTKSFKDDNTLLHIPGIPPIHASEMPTPLLVRDTDVYNNFLQTGTQMSKSNGIILNTFELLETKAVKAISDGLCVPDGPTASIFCIGPLISTNHVGDEHECMSWLNSQPSRSVLFLCFGSMGLFSAKQLKEIATGLENCGHRFLWVVRAPPAENKSQSQSILTPEEPNLDELLPQGFLERTKDKGRVVKSWIPQMDVLSHDSVGGFVTHCGWNSVLEAVCAGVPMIAWPLYAEQKMNMVFMVKEMKVAVALTATNESEDGFVSAGELEKRVRELMESDRGKEVRERVLGIRNGAVATMKEGGSSLVALAKLAHLWKQTVT
ncbi:anthocyanidin 5,3-O-glucosyltransferase-like [Corylus avellana]|uniref:anthocyanidin 5,3-O-glucosyltransferase-like n=1 Tax=Corylus avellana TaxID=13451 RepID=UPI001E211E36|nr:anthocyanidin 5,3-O-glucosyltransferase-like [Corylus avellana]